MGQLSCLVAYRQKRSSDPRMESPLRFGTSPYHHPDAAYEGSMEPGESGVELTTCVKCLTES